jgi:hypothetical protein
VASPPGPRLRASFRAGVPARARLARRQPRLRCSPRVLTLRSERELWGRWFRLGRETEATGEGMEALGSEENPRDLQDLKGWQSTKSRAGLMRFNRTCGVPMGRDADASSASLHDVYQYHCGGRRVKMTRQVTGALHRPPCGSKTRGGASSQEAARRLAASSRAASWSRLAPRRPEELRKTQPQ